MVGERGRGVGLGMHHESVRGGARGQGENKIVGKECKMTTVSLISCQNDAGLRALTVVL